MTEQPARRNLLAGIASQPSAPPTVAEDQVFREAAERHGFTGAGSAPPTLRRKRTGAGRSHQLNVRLRPDTAGFIYDEANRRDVPIAQVIEDAIEALIAREKGQR